MAKQNTKSKKGFTIIEVVLVLAIAGLIFLMVFIALPALQRSQRDTARRNDMSRVDTSLTQYQTNNQGTNGNSNLPYTTNGSWGPGVSEFTGENDCKRSQVTSNNQSKKSACVFIRNYMNSGTADNNSKNTFQDPDGTFYGMNIGTGAFSYDKTEMDHIIYVRNGAKCEGEAAVASTPRHYAIIYRLEGAGTYCIDDQ